MSQRTSSYASSQDEVSRLQTLIEYGMSFGKVKLEELSFSLHNLVVP